MTEISINSAPLKNEFNSNATVNELIHHILNNRASDTDIITAMTIDGKLLSAEDETRYMAHTIGQHKQIDLEIKSDMDLAHEALDSCNGYVDTIVAKIHELIELYSENRQQEANATFAEVVDIIDLYVQLISKITSTFRRNMGNRFKTSTTIQNLEIHLLSVMKAMLPAKEKNDIIMLCDLLEYELIDNLTQWKIKAIPELRKTREQ